MPCCCIRVVLQRHQVSCPDCQQIRPFCSMLHSSKWADLLCRGEFDICDIVQQSIHNLRVALPVLDYTSCPTMRACERAGQTDKLDTHNNHASVNVCCVSIHLEGDTITADDAASGGSG